MSFKVRPLTAAVALMFTGALSPQVIFAQTAMSADKAPEDKVVITASKINPIGQSGQMSSEAISHARTASSDAARLLQDFPGVSLYGAGGVSSLPSIHGLADDRLRVKVDGMDLIASCPNHMNPPLSYVDPTHIGKVKVYAGLAPVSVGGDSIGGSIVVESFDPVFASEVQANVSGGEIGTFYRSNGHSKGGHLAAHFATDAVSLNYAGSTAEAENYKAGGEFKTYVFSGREGHTLEKNEVGSTAYKTENHTLGLAFKAGDHMVEAKLGYQDLPYQNYPNQRMDMLGNEQKRLNLRYLGRQDWGSLEVRAYQEEVEHFMDFGADKRYWYGTASGGNTALNGASCSPIGATCATGMPMYTEGKTVGAAINARMDLAPQELLRVGAELQQYRLDDWWPVSGAGMWPNPFININDGERDRTAVFGEWEKHFSPQWMSMAGVRFERVSSNAGPVHGYDQSTAPTVGTPAGMMNQTMDAAAFNLSERAKTDNNWDATAIARFTVDEAQDIDFGVARKTRSPNLYERYTWSTAQMMMIMNNTVGDGNGYVGDVNLKPEIAHTLSATLDWHAPDRHWEFKATPYYTRVTDYIDGVRCAAGGMGNCTGSITPNPSTTSFLRLKYANQSARIYGLDLSGKAQIGETGVGVIGLKGVISYANGKNRYTDSDLYNVMPLNGKLTVSQKFGSWDNSIEWVGVAAKDSVSLVRNEIKTPGYGLIHLRGSYAWSQVRLDFGVENIFDKYYALPNGGAYTGQGTTMSNPALPNYPQWGTPVPGMGRSVYAGLNLKF